MENEIITPKELFFYVYDFLKRNALLSKFVRASTRYHQYDLERRGIGSNDAKGIIYTNIIRFRNTGYNLTKISRLFVSFDGSFEWGGTIEGNSYWREQLLEKWEKYVDKKGLNNKILERNESVCNF